jgi:hypothetical protein
MQISTIFITTEKNNYMSSQNPIPFQLEVDDVGKKKIEAAFLNIRDSFFKISQRIEKVSIENAELRAELDHVKTIEKLDIHFEIPLKLNYEEEQVCLEI